jgi:hypothetical protein
MGGRDALKIFEKTSPIDEIGIGRRDSVEKFGRQSSFVFSQSLSP